MKFTDYVKESPGRTSVLNISEYPHIKDSDLFRVLRHLPKLSVHGPWVAGGSMWRTINNEPLEKCDIDIFFQNEKQYEETVLRMNSLPVVNNIVKEIKNKWNTIYKFHVHEAKTFDKTVDVQFINMNFQPNLESLLGSFDFTVCQVGYDGENILVGLDTMNDLAAKRIKFYNITRPKTMFKHLHKYLNNGFTIPSDETKKLTYQLLQMNCWKNSNQPDYDDEGEKKEEKDPGYATPGTARWDIFDNNQRDAAPVVEQDEDPIVGDRPRRRNVRGPRTENEGRENRRITDLPMVNERTDNRPTAVPGWIPATGNGNENNNLWGAVYNTAQPQPAWNAAVPTTQPTPIVMNAQTGVWEENNVNIARGNIARQMNEAGIVPEQAFTPANNTVAGLWNAQQQPHRNDNQTDEQEIVMTAAQYVEEEEIF